MFDWKAIFVHVQTINWKLNEELRFL